ncbi:MAG: DedA family protein [Patescibacteria group bacterium]|nr:DedA family protein [Patescibacteria group bacterium]
MLGHLTQSIIHLIQTTGYLGIFILMTLESALIPIPSEVTMSFSGFLAGRGNLSFAGAVLAGTLGNLLGSLIAYGIGYFLEEKFILAFIERHGKVLLFSKHDYERSVNWLKKYGERVVFFSRLLPGIRTFISLPAGLSEMNLKKFCLYTFLGSLVWSFLLAYTGYYLGVKWNTIDIYFKKFEILIGAALVFIFLFYLNRKLKILKFSH